MSERSDFDQDPEFLDGAGEVNEEFSSPRVEQDVLALMYAGHIEQTFEWGGHTFVMATPKGSEEIAIAQLINDYQGTMAQGRALIAAQVAASLQMVDGREIYVSLGDESASVRVRKKFTYILDKWNFFVIETIHSFWQELQRRQGQAMEELSGK